MSLRKGSTSARKSGQADQVQQSLPQSPAALDRACREVLRPLYTPRFEPLEQRMMMAVDPVIVYSFNSPPNNVSGTTVEDESVENTDNDGTLVEGNGGPAPTFATDNPSPGGGAYVHFEGDGAFNGTGGRIDTQAFLGGVDAVNRTQGPLSGTASLSFYIRTTQVGVDNAWQSPGVTGSEHQGDGNDTFWGNLDAQGRIRVQAGDGASARSTNPINDGTWHQVVQTRNATTGQLRTYVDGVLNSSVNGDAGNEQANFKWFGATGNVNSLRRVDGHVYLNGDLDQVEVFDRVLSPTEVATRFGPTPSPDAAPVAPTVTATSTAPSSNVINFSGVTNALGFEVLRSASAAGPFTSIGLAGPTATSFTDTNVSAGQTFFYTVRAFNKRGTGAQGTPVSVTTATAGNGARARYFDDGFWGQGNRTQVIVGSQPTVQTFVSTVDFDYGGGSPAAGVSGDNHSTVFTGRVTVPQDFNGDGTNGGTIDVTFISNSDDDGHLLVEDNSGNQVLASTDPGGHGQRDAATLTPVTVTEGQSYDFVLLQAEGGGGSGVHLKWFDPRAADGAGASVVIPSDALQVTSDSTAAGGFKAPTSVAATPDAYNIPFTFNDNSSNEIRFELVRDGVVIGQTGINGNNLAGGNGTGLTINDAQPIAGTHSYVVRAVNGNGDVAASAAVSVNVPARPDTNGTIGHFFNSRFWGTSNKNQPAGQQAVGNPDLSEYHDTVDFDYGTNAPAAGIDGDNHSTVWTGKVQVPVPAGKNAGDSITVTFISNSDDDGELYINNTLASSDPGGHGQRDAGTLTPVTVAAGSTVDYVLLQAEQGGGSGVHLKWVNPATGTREVIPKDNLIVNAGVPAAPTGVSSTAAGASFVQLAWTDASTNEVRYEITRTGGTGGPVTFVSRINSNGFTDSTVSANTSYTYTVKAVNFEGAGSSSAVTVNTSATDPIPAVPTNARGAARAEGVRVVFNDASSNETAFVIERANAATPTAFTEVGRAAGSAGGSTGGLVTFTDTDVTAGQQYIYRVRAVNLAAGGVEQSSAPSNTFTITAGSPGGTGVTLDVYNRVSTGNFQSDVTNPDTGEVTTVNAPIETLENAPSVDTFGGGAPGPLGLGGGGGGGGFPGLTADAANPDPNETFSGIFQGLLQAEFTETYTFFTASDDGIDFTLIDPDTGTVLVNGPTNGITFRRGLQNPGFAESPGSAALTAGKKYLVQWRFTEDGGGAGYRVGWQSPSTPQEALPQELLFGRSSITTLFAPNPVTALALGADQITVTFNDFNFIETGYEVERATVTNGTVGNFAKVGDLPPNTASFVDTTGLALNTTYAYRVRAKGANGTFGPYSTPVQASTQLGGTTVTISGSTVILPGADGDISTGADNIARITDNVNDQTGGVFLTNARPITAANQGTGGNTTGFNTQFDFRIPEVSGSPADGFAFVIQRNSPNTRGGGGGGLGYAGINNSLAIKFDIYQNINQTGLYVNGAMDDAGTDIGTEIDNGTTFRVNISYDAGAKIVTVHIVSLDANGQVVTPDNGGLDFTQTYDAPIAGDTRGADGLDLATILGGTNAFFGFTGATGGENAEFQVLNWKVNGESIPFVTQPTGVTVQDVYVRGSAWTPAFLSFLATQPGQNSNLGFKVTGFTASTSPILSFTNLNTVAVKFSGPAPTVAASAITITSAAGRTYTVSSVATDPTNSSVLLITLANPIQNDRVTISAAGLGSVSLNVLPGDANQSGGAVQASDLVLTRNRVGRTTANPGTGNTAYSIFNDFDGNGVINATDLVLVRNRVGQAIPPAPAGVFANSRIRPAGAVSALQSSGLL